MKKILCLIFAILMPTLMLTSCKSKDAETPPTAIAATVKEKQFTAGVYYIASDDPRSVQIQIRDDNKIAIQYNRKTATEPGKYKIEGDVLRATITKTGNEYVFTIKDGKLFYDAASSKPSDKFVSDSGIVNGTEFYLDHGFEAR